MQANAIHDQVLAPFGGITRIRFKGFVYDVSAIWAPPLFYIMYALYIGA